MNPTSHKPGTFDWPPTLREGLFKAILGAGCGLLSLGIFFLLGDGDGTSAVADKWFFFVAIGALAGWFLGDSPDAEPDIPYAQADPRERTSAAPQGLRSWILLNGKRMSTKPLGVAGIGAIMIIIATLSVAIGSELGQELLATNKLTVQSVQRELTLVANRFNDRAPVMVGPGLRLEGASVEPGRTLVYHYTLISETPDTGHSAWLYDELVPAARENLCAADALELPLRLGTRVIYSYSRRDGSQIERLELSNRDCE